MVGEGCSRSRWVNSNVEQRGVRWVGASRARITTLNGGTLDPDVVKSVAYRSGKIKQFDLFKLTYTL